MRIGFRSWSAKFPYVLKTRLNDGSLKYDRRWCDGKCYFQIWWRERKK